MIASLHRRRLLNEMEFSIILFFIRHLFFKRFGLFKILITFAWFLVGFYYFGWLNEYAETKYTRRVVETAKTRWKPECGENEFSLYGMKSCVPLLGCNEINNEVKKSRKLNEGGIKEVYLAFWKRYTVAWVEMREYLTTRRKFLIQLNVYKKGIQILKLLQSSENFVTKIIGSCGDVTITEYHPLGRVQYLDQVMHAVYGRNHQSASLKRMQLCIYYVSILDHLHSSNPNKTYVMCDTNSLELISHQYLLTDKLRLVLNDVDRMAIIDNTAKNKISCGVLDKMDLMAPEMVLSAENTSKFKVPFYDEKIDIWKIPNICNYFLGKNNEKKVKLKEIHTRCKFMDPRQRPSAKEVLEVYKNIQYQ